MVIFYISEMVFLNFVSVKIDQMHENMKSAKETHLELERYLREKENLVNNFNL